VSTLQRLLVAGLLIVIVGSSIPSGAARGPLVDATTPATATPIAFAAGSIGTGVATPAAATQMTPTPVNGDGFWFTGGVQATLLNRVVRMTPDTPAAVRSLVAEVVRQINAASGAGVVIGPDTTDAPATTEIVVRAPTTTVCGPDAAGCASNAVATVDGYGVVVNAVVEIDRDLLGSGYELPILLHEMGHAMGLGHYDSPYDGRMQVMWNSVTSDMTSYRSGDRNGLAALGAVFTNRNVIGNIDRIDLVPGGVRVLGWALDLDAPDLALGLAASLDGAGATGVADAYRPDVGSVYPTAGPGHGIDLVVPTAGLSGGLTLCLVATGGRGVDVGIGCRATSATHVPLGNLDLAQQAGPAVVGASGWALDPDTAEATAVELLVDGAVVATTSTDQPRPDVTRVYPGFPGPRGWTVTASVAPGSRRVCARALDTTGDDARILGCRTVAVGGGDPIGNVDGVAPSTAAPLLLEGWAIDPDTTDTIDIHLYVDGRYSRTATADRLRRDVGHAYPGYGDAHGFSIALPGLTAGSHVACAFAINELAGTRNTLLGCRAFETAGVPPVGNVDTVAVVDGRRSLLGWAIDPDTINPINVHLWADGRYLGAGTANRVRPDVGRAFPAYGSGHGFAIPVDRLTPGSHRVCAYGIDASGAGPNPLLRCQWINVG
jgi:hypothetical protein